MTPEDIANRFTFHAPDQAKALQHAAVRNGVLSLADWLNAELPEGREKSLAMTHLEEVTFWANAAIARQPGEPPTLNTRGEAP